MKEFPEVSYESTERIVDIPQIFRTFRPFETTDVNTVDCVREVMKPEYRYVDKPVARMETREVAKVVEVPFVLSEEKPVFTQKVQVAEQVREMLQPVVKRVQREVPRVKMEYVEKVAAASSDM